MKEYSVSFFSSGKEIQLGSLPVAKINHYPLEKHDYKPYAQAVMGISEQKIGIRLLSFEALPPKSSQLGTVLYLFPNNPSAFVEIWATPEKVKVSVGGSLTCDIKAEIHRQSGEDLQGVYWGYDIFIDINEIQGYGKVVSLEDKTFKGNFFKINKEERTHFGAFDLAEFKDNIAPENDKMSELRIIRY